MILYCAENATQVALDGIQCLGKCQGSNENRTFLKQNVNGTEEKNVFQSEREVCGLPSGS